MFGAYAFARLRFRGQRASLLLFLSTYMVPPIALVIPLYLIMVRLHLLNTRIGLIIVYCTFATPFVLWIMGNYFQTIPRELEDAARIDGCTRIGALFRVILPLARPGLLSTMLFAFLIAWDEFLYALIFTSTTAAKTIPVAIAEFTGRYTTDFGLQAAGGILAAIPPVADRRRLPALHRRRAGLGGGEGMSEWREAVTRQPANLAAAAGAFADAIAELDLETLRRGTIVFAGIGASAHALIPAVLALRAAGRRAFALQSTELAGIGRRPRGSWPTRSCSSPSRARAPRRSPRWSGSRACRWWRSRARGDSPLAEASDAWLPLGPEPDTPVATLSYTATLQALGMLCDALLGETGSVWSGCRRSPGRCWRGARRRRASWPAPSPR